MNISEKCFNDPAIRSYISTNGKTGLCEHTGEITEVIDVIDLSDYFETFSDAFIEDKDGTPFYDKIQNEWNIFNDQCGREILEAILNELDSNIKVDTPVKYSNDIEGSASEWERIKHGLINEYRYLTVKELDGESYFEQIFAVHETQLPIGLSLYRSRINKNGEDTPYSKNEMGAPPKHLATAGRANPEGIPFLYLSSSPETTFYETRAIYLDTLSTGVFKSKRVLKIVDFAKPSSPFNPIYENVITGIICENDYSMLYLN